MGKMRQIVFLFELMVQEKSKDFKCEFESVQGSAVGTHFLDIRCLQ